MIDVELKRIRFWCALKKTSLVCKSQSFKKCYLKQMKYRINELDSISWTKYGEP